MRIKEILEEHGLRPQKKWGQHFLTDPRILESIADAAEVSNSDTVLEIGPGLGHLTRVLARRAGQLVAVEVDAGLAAKLQSDLADASNVRIVQGNILDAEPIEWIQRLGNRIAGAGSDPAPVSIPFKVVANLPYYITSAILRHILEATAKPSVIVVMVQREVAQRMIACPPAMNLLAVSVQFFAHARIVRTIAPGAFYPPPKVESAVVRLDVAEHPLVPLSNTARFFDIVRAGFGEKRKQLRNSLAHGLDLEPDLIAKTLIHARIDPVRRAETLTLEEWGNLYKALANHPIAETD
jgi:16S rRNA (adenine1518-N6/adenine1519-N6)-dimethyltransferase